MRLLVAEDDRRIAEDVRTVLTSAGYAVDLVRNGEEAWFKGDTEDYGLIVLDLGLPGMDGISVLKQWRMSGRHTPVLVLTARGSWAERVEGIDAGADDYLPKPFQFEELLARVRALIRRSVGHGAATIEIGRLVVDTRMMRVAVDGIPLSLTPFEFRLDHMVGAERIEMADALIRGGSSHDLKIWSLRPCSRYDDPSRSIVRSGNNQKARTAQAGVGNHLSIARVTVECSDTS